MTTSFDAILNSLRSGAVDELTGELQALVLAVRESGKTGTLTLKMTVKPASNGDVETVFIIDEITSKRPKPDRPATLFYAAYDGELTRQDPRQRDIEFKTVSEKDEQRLRGVK